MRFNALERGPSLADGIVATVMQAIGGGELRPGDRLPSEQELARDFKVARTVVREAISQLKYDGVVQSRKGVGAFVADPSERTAFRIGPECFAKRKQLLKLMRLRTGVAAEAAAEAASNRSKRQVVEMIASVAQMRAALIDPASAPERFYEAERRLVQTIGIASRNEHSLSLIGMIDRTIAEKLRSVAVKNAKAAGVTESIVASYERIVTLISARDADGAREEARRHYDKAARRLADRADLADV